MDRTEFERWREAAADARRGAEVQRDAGLHNWSCFLAEQAAQLAMKGLLHALARGVWGNDLVALGERLRMETETALPPSVAAALRRLSRHYIPPRYPDAHSAGAPLAHYGPSDSEDALADADLVIGHLDGIWGELLSSSGETPGVEGGG